MICLSFVQIIPLGSCAFPGNEPWNTSRNPSRGPRSCLQSCISKSFWTDVYCICTCKPCWSEEVQEKVQLFQTT
ncbi:hypothetical protein EDD86DRAFT_196871 [Gorgonomyces haynaldii]|nr:hypothetical protein EDD86DRAFT_196871 [Gorgonomyces haynaldii]